MHTSLRSCLAACALALPWLASAAELPSAAAAPAAPAAAGEPQVLQQVTEDEQVRIEELRVRGQTRRLTVQPKIKGMPSYEIVPPEPGREPSQDPKAGLRVWLSLTF